MSRLWRDELRIGVCPDRLVVAKRERGLRRRLSYEIRPAAQDSLQEVRLLAHKAKVAVVLSNHYVRYAVLEWSSTLTSAQDWNAYAQHAFYSVYGNAASGWAIRACDTGHRAPRLACAVDAQLIDSLRALPGVISIQPYLMAAFNARRHALAAQSSWLVLQEPGRLTLGLIVNGLWKLVRTRQQHGDWRGSLAETLDREHLASEQPECARAVLCTEEDPPLQAGRYRLVDLTLPRGASQNARPLAMVLH